MVQLIGRRWMHLAWPMALLLQGCVSTGGFISEAKFTSLDYKPDPVCDSQDPVVHQGCTPERQNSLAFAPIFDNIWSVQDVTIDTVFLELRGSGQCGELRIDFGDGSPIETYLDKRIFNGLQFKHTYSGWPGKKIARVNAVQNCTGSRTAEVLVGFKPDGRDFFRLAFIPNLFVCNRVPNVPPLRAGTTVRITTNGSTIQYGIPVFNASGDPTTTTPANFPFPRHRMFSLVYQIGTQAVQGEAGPVIFRVAQTGPLEICVNDHRDDLADNRGSMRIDITVNEGSATSP
jgi:hypothetical protein